MGEVAREHLANRLNRLEHQNSWLKRFGVAALLALAAFVIAVRPAPGDSTAPEVRAKRFVLVDDAGMERAVLGLQPNGAMGLIIRARDGSTQTTVGEAGILSLQNDGRALGIGPGRLILTYQLYAKDTMALLHVDGDGSISFVLHDEHRPRATVSIAKDGTPSMKLSDNNGKVIWQVP